MAGLGESHTSSFNFLAGRAKIPAVHLESGQEYRESNTVWIKELLWWA